YRQARSALQCLRTDPEYLVTLHDITDNDLKVARDLTDERRFGQRSDTLPWFWWTGNPADVGSPHMQEFYRVSWLRAKAHFCRWSEELTLVEYEMKWTVNWFHWQENKWKQRLRDVDDEERPAGLDSYGHKQVALWNALAD
ncbi:hypothetical protein PILCRDRAFT_80226, partial [Piloderma croceum F 1598]